MRVSRSSIWAGISGVEGLSAGFADVGASWAGFEGEANTSANAVSRHISARGIDERVTTSVWSGPGIGASLGCTGVARAALRGNGAVPLARKGKLTPRRPERASRLEVNRGQGAWQ